MGSCDLSYYGWLYLCSWDLAKDDTKAKDIPPKGRRLPKWDPPKEPTIVFRGDKRAPGQIAASGGFSPRDPGKELSAKELEDGSSLFQHVTGKTNAYTKYVSTSSDPSAAYKFGGINGYLYAIKPDSKMVDVRGSLGRHVEERFRNEMEQSSIGTIPFEQVQGWYKKSDIRGSDLLQLRDPKTIGKAFQKNDKFDTKYEQTRGAGAHPELSGFPADSEAWKENPWKKYRMQKVSDLLNGYVKDTLCGGSKECFEQYWTPKTLQPDAIGHEDDVKNAEGAGGSEGTETAQSEGEKPPKKTEVLSGKAQGAKPETDRFPGAGKDANALPGQNGIKSPCTGKSLKRSIGCDAVEKEKYSTAKDLEVRYSKSGTKGLIEFENKELTEAENKGLVKSGTAELTKDATRLLGKVTPIKSGFISASLLGMLAMDRPPFWKALVDGIEHGDFSAVDCQIGFKKALSKAIDHRYAEFDSAWHALMSIINIGMDIFELIDIKIPLSFWMDLMTELPTECKEIHAATTPEEKLKVANEGLDTLVQAWAKYTPVGIENERWMEHNAANASTTMPEVSVALVALEVWSATSLGWVISKIGR